MPLLSKRNGNPFCPIYIFRFESPKLNQIYYTFSTVMKTCVPLPKEKEKK